MSRGSLLHCSIPTCGQRYCRDQPTTFFCKQSLLPYHLVNRYPICKRLFTLSLVGTVGYTLLYSLLFFQLYFHEYERFYKQQSHFCVCLQVFHRWSRRNMYAARNMQDFRHSCRVSFLQIRKSGVKLCHFLMQLSFSR